MNATDSQPALRPLGLGEVLDRAVTLCVRHFVPLSTIYVVYAVPFAVIAYYATRDFQALLQTMTDTLQQSAATGKPADQAQIARALGSGGGFNGWTLAVIVATVFIGPFPAAALIEATAATYLGRTVTFGGAYRAALGRWAPLVGVNVLYFVAGSLLYVALALVLAFLILGLAFLGSTLHAVGIAIDVVVGLSFALVALAFGVVATLAFQISYFTCVVERANPVVAFAQGLTRVFVGVGLQRSLLVGAAFVAIGIGISVVSLAGQSLLRRRAAQRRRGHRVRDARTHRDRGVHDGVYRHLLLRSARARRRPRPDAGRATRAPGDC